MTCANTVTLGAYLLGALDPRERFEFEAHLGGCDTCRAELVRLAPLPGMLNQISLDDFSDGLPPTTLEEAHPTAPVPGLPLSTQLRRPEIASLPDLAHPELFRAEAGFPDEPIPPELGGPVPSPRGPVPAREVPPPARITPDPPGPADTPVRAADHRRYWRVAATAAAVLVLVVAGVLGWRALEPEPVAPAAAGITWTASTPDGSATADARLVDHEWGTEIQMRIHGLPPGRQCYAIVYDKYGYHEIAGWWGTDHDDAEEIPASTSIQRSKIEKIELLLDDRKVVLTIPAQHR
jgi:anti-sigma factor RsiW